MSRKQLFFMLAIFACVATVVPSMIPGGLEGEKAADEHVKSVVSSVQRQLLGKYPREFVSITPVSYRTQVVAGINYFVKAMVTEKNGKKSYAHLRIYNSFDGENELTSIKTDLDAKQPLKYFQ